MDKWHILLVVGAAVVGCGGKADSDSSDGGANVGGADAGGSNTGGANVSGGADAGGSNTGGANASGGADAGGSNTGGASVSGGADASGGILTGGGQSGGESSVTGGEGGNGCNEFLLWRRMADMAIGGLGDCNPSYCLAFTRFGTLTFDSEGQVIDLTGVSPDYEEEWLNEVASERWLCLASQTIEFCCVGNG